MMMIIEADKNNVGFWSFEISSPKGIVEFGGKYPTKRDAEVAGTIAHRIYHQNFVTPEKPLQNDYMTDDELLSELDM